MHSDWLIVGCSLVMPRDRLLACRSQAKKPFNKQLINLGVFTGKSQTSAMPYLSHYLSVNVARSRSEIFL